MGYILETERLGLREFTLHDAAFIIGLLNSPGWLQFIGDRNVKTEQDAIAYLTNGPIKSYNENGFGLSIVEIKKDKTEIGMCGIIKREGLQIPDIGFAFLPQFMGKGYALEIARATLSYAQSKLSIAKIAAITVPANIRSIRLLEKLGFSFIKRFSFAPNGEELLLYGN